MEMVRVDPANVHQFWPAVKSSIYLAMKRGGIGSFQYVESCVFRGGMQLWLVVTGEQIKSAVVTEIYGNEFKRVGVIVACGGRDMSKWLGLIDQIEAWFKAQDCSASRIYGREGWQRMLPEYQRKRVVLEKEL